MQQVGNVWANLDSKKKIMVGASILTVGLTIFLLLRIAAAPSMKLLYAGLDGASAGEVIAALEQGGMPFEVRGSSIYVPAANRDELRLSLAGEGLPANGGRGYELLDSLNGFGTTSRMFDAAYWRAKEGELARTIVAGPHIAKARVHIATGSADPFRRATDISASVSVTSTGGVISPEQAKAIRFLVASAISGLSVENVTVIDASGVLLGETEMQGSKPGSEDQVQRLRERVLRLLEARVGRGNAVVEVSVDRVTETESIRERRFDPNGRVAISTETEERSDSNENQTGEVTVASNLPDGDGATDDSSKSQTSSTRERINYEVSETEMEILRAPGAIRRLSVAALVNFADIANADGTTTSQPRSEAELTAMQELVASAVGYDEARGDAITIKSMQLSYLEPAGTEAAAPSLLDRLGIETMPLIQMAMLGAVALGLGAFVVRPVLLNAKALPPPKLEALPESPATSAPPPALTGEIQMTEQERGLGEGGARPAALMVPADVQRPDDSVDRLRELIGDKQEESVEILRSWLQDNRENA